MEELGLVAEADEVRGTGACLGHIENLQAAALVGGRLDTSGGIGQQRVQHTGGDTGGCLLVHVLDELEQARHTLTGHSRNKDNGGIGHVGQVLSDLCPHLIHGLVVLLDGVPLVDHDDAGLAGIVGHTGHLGVLFGHTLVGVDHDETDVGTLNGHGSTKDRELFDLIVDLGLLTHTGGVNEDELTIFVLKVAVHRITGGTCHVGDNDTLLPQDPVDEGGLTHVGLADDGNLHHIGLLFQLLLLGEVLQAGIQQITGTMAVDGRDGDGIAQAQVVELVNIGVGHAHLVHFVDSQDDGLSGPQKHIGHVLVGGGEAGLDVTDKDDDVGVGNGDLGLLAHEGQDLGGGAGFDTASIHDIEGAAAPFALSIEAVAGNAGGVLHDRDPTAYQLVKQHGLTHVGAAHDGDERFGHSEITSLIYKIF